jgi:hypothetical protein
MASEGVTMAEPSVKPIELSFPMPKAPETRIHMHLTIQTTSLLLFLTTALNGNTSEAVPLGSFVYALPDVRYNSPITTSQYYTDSDADRYKTEVKPRSNAIDGVIYVRKLDRIHNASCKVTSEEDVQACLCG